MSKRYKVTQRSKEFGVIHTKTYRWRWYARYIAWLVSGPGAFFATPNDHYTASIEEVEA
jgi:bacteriorhodopsin